MKFILGEKVGMTMIFDAGGDVVPVTVVLAKPNTVIGVRSKERDGYEAVQLGAGEKKPKNVKKPQKGHFKDLGNFRFLREFRIPRSGLSGFKFPSRGEKIGVSAFKEGEIVKVSGISKAKGFQGVVKRHGFHGAPATHGTKHAHREPGSIGGGGRAGGRVVKGMRMAGRMGGGRVSALNLKIAKVDAENDLLLIKGGVPGRKGTLLEIRSL